MAALLAGGVEPETFEPEYGVGQFEVSCAPAAGLAGADRAVFSREIIREAARQCGLRATFTPKAAPDAVGNGCHAHVSLWDEAGRPAAFDPRGPGGLSAIGQHFVAGMQRHLRALLALIAPSPVSYPRLRPHHWSCGYDAVGAHNREAAIRLCPSPETEEPARAAGFNIEIRATDATANPYLALGALLRAGPWRASARSCRCPRSSTATPTSSASASAGSAASGALPGGLAEALDLFEADGVVRSWFAPVMTEAYTEVKRLEARIAAGCDLATLCRRYARAY